MSELTWTNEIMLIVEPGEPPERLSVTWPNNDKVDHDHLSLSCVCVPDYKLYLCYHNKVGCECVVHEVVHHSLDGRELFE